MQDGNGIVANGNMGFDLQILRGKLGEELFEVVRGGLLVFLHKLIGRVQQFPAKPACG